MNNCELLCPDLLELLALLAAKVEYLYLFYRNLSLSDLTDVKDCLAPTRDLHLVYDGTIWDAADQTNAELTIEPLLDSGVQIANITFNGETTTLYCKDGTVVTVTPASISGPTMDIATITVDGVTKTIKSKDFTGVINEIWEIINNLHPTEVNVLADYTTGTKVATITVNNQSTDIKIPTATNVQVDAEDIPGGTTIATITVDGTPTQIKAPSGGGEGNLNNIEVNNIEGTVEDKVAKVTVYGSDIITGTEYAESEEVNEDLEIETTDTIDESLGKLQKALKDDEAAVTLAFNSVMEAAGFDEMLHYLKEPEGTILGDDENVHSLKTADAKLLTKIKENIDRLTLHEGNSLIFVPYGTPAAGTSTNTFSVGDKNINDLPYVHVILLPLLVIFNLTADYPLPANEYWAMGSGSHNVISLEMANYLYTDVLIRSGCILTFLTSATTWESYQYIGPNEGNRISVNGWTTPGNWYKLWTATLT